MAGPSRAITADPDRRPITRRAFVEAHFRPGSRPFGHGFSEQNRQDGTAYYVHDTPAARLIALDTNCLAGGSAGCLDREQARWLEARLAEVHSSYRGPDGGQSAPATMTAWSSCSRTSLHRELAANVPFLGADSGRAGAVTDRNVELRMVPPFPLDRAGAA
jgi:hypothetical protein